MEDRAFQRKKEGRRDFLKEIEEILKNFFERQSGIFTNI